MNATDKDYIDSRLETVSTRMLGEVRTITADMAGQQKAFEARTCLLYTSPSPRDRQKSRMPSSA